MLDINHVNKIKADYTTLGICQKLLVMYSDICDEMQMMKPMIVVLYGYYEWS